MTATHLTEQRSSLAAVLEFKRPIFNLGDRAGKFAEAVYAQLEGLSNWMPEIVMMGHPSVSGEPIVECRLRQGFGNITLNFDSVKIEFDSLGPGQAKSTADVWKSVHDIFMKGPQGAAALPEISQVTISESGHFAIPEGRMLKDCLVWPQQTAKFSPGEDIETIPLTDFLFTDTKGDYAGRFKVEPSVAVEGGLFCALTLEILKLEKYPTYDDKLSLTSKTYKSFLSALSFSTVPQS